MYKIYNKIKQDVKQTLNKIVETDCSEILSNLKMSKSQPFLII